MSIEDAKSQAQSARRTQIDTDRGSDFSYSKSGARQSSRDAGGVGRGADGATWQRSDIDSSINGGIITQLIKQAEDQLGEVDACIVLYQEQKAKIQQRLEELKHLQAAADQPEKEG
jgi:hypothetical protein